MPTSHRSRRRAGTALATLAALALLTAVVAVPEASAAAASAVDCSAGATMNIVAHEDDDLLFLSPDLLADVKGNKCVRTVFVTAGDAGQPAAYWLGREDGAKAAYGQMIGSGTWSIDDAGIAGHPIPVLTSTTNAKVSLVFLRLADGFSGGGSSRYGYESLLKLWQGTLETIHPVDGTAGYTKAELTGTLTSLMTAFRPNVIRTQDHVGFYGDGDHSDHHSAAYFAEAAHREYPTAHSFIGYQGYKTRLFPANVTGATLTAKQKAFYAYGAHDPRACWDTTSCGNGTLARWLLRQYRVSTNLAIGASATASSQNLSTGQTAAKVVDGVVDGCCGPAALMADHTREWATIGGRAGSWVKITWPKARTISKVVLYDRLNPNDQITGATLVFSNGSTVAVGALDNTGMAKIISFSSRTVTSVRLNITAVSGTTRNIGLAEMEAYATTGP